MRSYPRKTNSLYYSNGALQPSQHPPITAEKIRVYANLPDEILLGAPVKPAVGDAVRGCVVCANERASCRCAPFFSRVRAPGRARKYLRVLTRYWVQVGHILQPSNRQTCVFQLQNVCLVFGWCNNDNITRRRSLHQPSSNRRLVAT